jgi:hypothetical protein
MRRIIGQLIIFPLAFLLTTPLAASELPRGARLFVQKNCFECHDADVKKGDLNLVDLPFDPANSTNFPKWVLIYDRVDHGEMPPKKKARPAASELATFKMWLSSSLISADERRIAKEGRATRRRLNRYEYENALRDLLSAPWLQIRDSLPERRRRGPARHQPGRSGHQDGGNLAQGPGRLGRGRRSHRPIPRSRGHRNLHPGQRGGSSPLCLTVFCGTA